MGMIEVRIAGSFGKSNGSKVFSAQRHGHAHAVAEAIQHLSRNVLPAAIELDHKLQSEGSAPSVGWTAPEVEKIGNG